MVDKSLPETPPLARGILSVEKARVDLVGNTPACAGNTGPQGSCRPLRRKHPRLRGEYWEMEPKGEPHTETPPLARGIHFDDDLPLQRMGNTPACAGNTSLARLEACNRWKHPRLRGEYTEIATAHWTRSETPPLARGIPNGPRRNGGGHRNTPACAGNTLALSCGFSRSEKYPRLRGEYAPVRSFMRGSVETPPLARGILTSRASNQVIRGNTPACAGNTARSSELSERSRKHPRLRGEYAHDISASGVVTETPPLARGIPTRRSERGLFTETPPPARGIPSGGRRGVLLGGNTPACAGNTGHRPLGARQSRKHPRLRGEYCAIGRLARRRQETPPLARGILNFNISTSVVFRNTPACAGNTHHRNRHSTGPWKHPRLRGEYLVLTR